MIHNDELNNAFFRITPERLNLLKDISTFIGFCINFLYLGFASRKYHYMILDVPMWVIDTIQYLGYLQGSSSMLLIFFFTLNKKSLITKEKWRDFIQENQE